MSKLFFYVATFGFPIVIQVLFANLNLLIFMAGKLQQHSTAQIKHESYLYGFAGYNCIVY